MPYRYQLTWVRAKQNSGKCGGRSGYWCTRYQKRTFYLKTLVSGKTDRVGYLRSLIEAERLRLYVDGLGPNPYAGNRVKPDEVYERELRAFEGKSSQSLAELVERYLIQRQRAVEAGSLSVQQWAEDSRNLNAFSDWLGEIGIDDLSAKKLNRYRDHMQDSCNSPATLRKRLATPAKFIRWLVDESVIDRPPARLGNILAG